MDSPPRPRRQGLIGVSPGVNCNKIVIRQQKTFTTKQNQIDGSGAAMVARDFESNRVDQAVTKLPAVVSEVFTVQKTQSNEISKQQQLLQNVREKVKEVEELKCKQEIELRQVTQKLYMTQDQKHANQTDLQQLQNDITELIRKQVDKKMAVKDIEEQYEHTLKRFQGRYDEIEQYKEECIVLEASNSPVQKEITALQKQLAELQAQKSVIDEDPVYRDRLLSDHIHQGLQAQIDTLQLHVDDLTNTLHNIQHQVSEKRRKVTQAKQTINVLNKRNAAHMTRVKRQLEETQTLNGQLAPQIQKLNDNINNVTHKLSQFL